MDKYIETLSNVPALGVLLSAITMVIVGSLWYSPLLFGKAWARLSDRRLSDIQPAEVRRGYIFGFLTALFTAYLLGIVATHASAHPSALYSGVVFVWLFIMFEQANGFVWDRQPFALFLIQAFRSLFSLAAGASIFLFWS